MLQLFLSYARQDAAAVRQLSANLRHPESSLGWTTS
jgi:hypothetical protein